MTCMKRIGTALIGLLLAGAAWAQPQIRLETPTYSFDTLLAGEQVYYRYVFRNTGNEPLELGFVSSSCDCASPEWPHRTIGPGDTGTIRIAFNSTGKTGGIDKHFTLYDNLRQPLGRVFLKGYVKPVPPKPWPRQFSWKQKFSFNGVDPDTTMPDWKHVHLFTRLQRPEKVTVDILASASNVPTLTYGDNRLLAQERARQTELRLREFLRGTGVPRKNMVVKSQVKVQGPAYKPGNDAAYEPYQYVEVVVKLEGYAQEPKSEQAPVPQPKR